MALTDVTARSRPAGAAHDRRPRAEVGPRRRALPRPVRHTRPHPGLRGAGAPCSPTAAPSRAWARGSPWSAPSATPWTSSDGVSYSCPPALVAESADRRRLVHRRRPVPTRPPDRPAPAGPRHPHLVVLHRGALPPRTRAAPLATQFSRAGFPCRYCCACSRRSTRSSPRRSGRRPTHRARPAGPRRDRHPGRRPDPGARRAGGRRPTARASGVSEATFMTPGVVKVAC